MNVRKMCVAVVATVNMRRIDSCKWPGPTVHCCCTQWKKVWLRAVRHRPKQARIGADGQAGTAGAAQPAQGACKAHARAGTMCTTDLSLLNGA